MNGDKGLGRLQARGHALLDAIYGPLTSDVERAVAALAVDGAIPPGAAGRAADAVYGIVREAEPRIAAAIAGSVEAVEAAVVGEAAPFTAANARLEAQMSLARNRRMVADQVGDLVARGAARGLPPKEIARQAAQYFEPFYAPRWSADGRDLRRAGREGAVRLWPGRAGQASQHPRGLMLTLTTAKHSEGTLFAARRDGLGVKYNLSYKHRDIDECDSASKLDVGYGPGRFPAFPIGAAPRVPRHFRCRCYYSTISIDSQGATT